jgi:hypothetical protein
VVVNVGATPRGRPSREMFSCCSTIQTTTTKTSELLDCHEATVPLGAPLAMTTKANRKTATAIIRNSDPLTVFASQTVLSRKGRGNDTTTAKWKTALRDSALALCSTQNDRKRSRCRTKCVGLSPIYRGEK